MFLIILNLFGSSVFTEFHSLRISRIKACVNVTSAWFELSSGTAEARDSLRKNLGKEINHFETGTRRAKK